ncbi:MAG: DUF433 domain-containing protein [Planctomycetota bacterium]|nr:DUF433 domain-containing protein [Planctomycetota bacterium]
MNDDQFLARIISDPQILAGKPVIKGTRLSVDYILNLLGHSSTVEEILDEYGGLAREDIQACLLFASRALAQTEFMPLMAESA